MEEHPPDKLDGAKVLLVTVGRVDFGLVSGPEGDVEITALAIGQYEADSSAYIFACDRSWSVLGDLKCNSVTEALREAERYYETGPLVWRHIKMR